MADRQRQNNNNWKGGRVLASNGYVLVRVGKDHHLADVRGYAYEHRIVAEQQTGRRLRPGEEVHHKDDNRSNNSPCNLEVKKDRRLHAMEHRKRADLRSPGEANLAVKCECGCMAEFPKYDGDGRPRKILPGHNKQPAPSMEAVMMALKSSGPVSLSDISTKTGLSLGRISTALYKMHKRNMVRRVSPGVWRLSND